MNATLAAKSCIVTGNSAYVDGGGLRVSYLSNAVLDACEVSSNHGEKIFELPIAHCR